MEKSGAPQEGKQAGDVTVRAPAPASTRLDNRATIAAVAPHGVRRTILSLRWSQKPRDPTANEEQGPTRRATAAGHTQQGRPTHAQQPTSVQYAEPIVRVATDPTRNTPVARASEHGVRTIFLSQRWGQQQRDSTSAATAARFFYRSVFAPQTPPLASTHPAGARSVTTLRHLPRTSAEGSAVAQRLRRGTHCDAVRQEYPPPCITGTELSVCSLNGGDDLLFPFFSFSSFSSCFFFFVFFSWLAFCHFCSECRAFAFYPFSDYFFTLFT